MEVFWGEERFLDRLDGRNGTNKAHVLKVYFYYHNLSKEFVKAAFLFH